MKRIIRRMVTATLLLSSIFTFIFPYLRPLSPSETLSTTGPQIAPFFIANRGQMSDGVQFYVKGGQHSLFLKESGEAITRSIYKEESSETPDSSFPGVDTAHAETVREVGFGQVFVGANSGVMPKAGERATPTLNFFNDKIRATGVPTYNDLTYKNLYDGIDLTYRVSDGKKVKYDLIVGAGVDPGKIVMQFDGVQNLSVDDDGNLVMKTPAQTFTQNKPYVYQMVRGVERSVEGAYLVNADNSTVSFSLGAYDSSLPLVIDPVLDELGASTLLGGSAADSIYDLVGNASDQIYVVGITPSNDFNSISNGYDTTYNGNWDAFIARLDTDLVGLTYLTYIGGSGNDDVRDIELDSNGKVVITGFTSASGGYPTTGGTYSSAGAEQNVFVSRFSATLADLETSAVFGGDGVNAANALDIDSSNNIYVAGNTTSTDFPGVSGNYDSSYGGGGNDVFIAKLPSDLTTLESTYLGGSANDQIDHAFLVDSSGNVYVGGYTVSSNFPTTAGAYDETSNAGGFISKLSSDLTVLTASTGLTSSGVVDMDFDSNGALYVAIDTAVMETTAGVYQSSVGKIYIGKLTSDLSTLSIGTYFGPDDTFVERIALDINDNVYIAGSTSDALPTTVGAYDDSFNGIEEASAAGDVFISIMPANLGSLTESTYVGGGDIDDLWAMELSAEETNVFIAGTTLDAVTTDYPTTVSAYDTTHNGSYDGFVSILGALAGGGSEPGVPEFSTYVYLITLLWCGYLLHRKLHFRII